MEQYLCSYKLLWLMLMLFTYSNSFTINLKPKESCASVCSGNDKIFKFEENKIYVYNFLSRQSIKNPNAENEMVQLELKGKAELSKISACDFSLQLSSVTFEESLSAKKESKKNYKMVKNLVEKFNLRFGFDDGRIVGVCPDNLDDEFAVNIKKAILSSLQVTLDNLDSPNYLTETDISGDCITEYQATSEPPHFVKIKKTKAISGCARRSKYFSTVTGKTFEEPMEDRNIAFIDGTYECNINMKRSDGLKESICKQIETFKPFSTQKSGSSIEITQELKFDSIKKGQISSKTPNTRSDLTMNHGEKSPMFMKMKLTSLQEIAKSLCLSVQKSPVSSEITTLFVKLIRVLAKSKYEEIKNVDKYFAENDACKGNTKALRNILLDAIPYAKNEDAFTFLVKDYNIFQFKKLSLSFVQNASPKIISLFAEKLDDDKVDNSVLLTLSSMVKSYCDKNAGCMQNPVIIKVMNRIYKNLGDNCFSASKGVSEKILFTLRAIGNAGNFPNYKSLVSTLKSCVAFFGNDDNVKVFAVEAVRQFPCNTDIDEFLWGVYDEINFSSELRIQAYLSLIRCPSRETFRKVIQKLETENSQQFGSFVWSHITNLMESSDRFKTELRDTLQIFTKPMNDLSRKFNLDFRSYSKNIEKTYRREYSAAKIDSNIIFTNSPLPTSVTANITFDVFGRSVNILEFGVRGKGAEKLFDTFSPESHKNPHEDVVKMDKNLGKKISKKNILMYTKVMGHEMFFTSDLLADLSKFAIKLLGKGSFAKTWLLFDSTVSVASITGFPIEISVKSAMSSHFKLSQNKIGDIKDFELAAKNNLAIQVFGKLKINAHCTKIGVKLTATATSDLDFGGKFKFINSEDKTTKMFTTNYQFEINKMPDDTKLISVSNEVTLIHNVESIESKPKYEVLIDKCTGSSMLELRGIKICGKVSLSPKYTSFFTNFKADLTAHKFNGFKFQFKKEYFEKPVYKMLGLLISTSFQGDDKDTFKFQFLRDLEKKKQMYELSLWNKDIYVKLDIDDKKLTGQLKYGEHNAIVSGAISQKGIFSIMIDMKVTSKTTELIVSYEQKFTKDGPRIVLTATKTGDKDFKLKSITTLMLSKHKIFNFFQRFRHSIELQMAGENKFFLVIEASKGNKPLKEIQAKFETYWKTKSTNNFYIKESLIGSKYWVTDFSVENEKIPGQNYTFKLDQNIEVKDKKFNVQHNFNYFVSDKFSLLGNKPSLMVLKLELYDSIEKKFIRQLNTKLFFDVMNPGKGTILVKNQFAIPQLYIDQNLKAKAVWKRNSLDMYDINAEVSESSLFKILLNHKFTTTQNGISSLEFKLKELTYTIISDLKLPKLHTLTVSWPENSFVIESKLSTPGTSPFKTEITHEIILNKKIIASVINTATYDNKKSQFSFNSIGSSEKETLYSLTIGGYLTKNIAIKTIHYDFLAEFGLKIPSKSLDFSLKTKQFANIIIDGKLGSGGKDFESSFTYLNKVNGKSYGYEIVSKTVKSPESYYEIKTLIHKGLDTDKILIKYGKIEKKFLIGISFDSEKLGSFEIFHKSNNVKEQISTSTVCSLQLKTNDMYNFYYKNNLLIIYQLKQKFSLTYSGEYGKSKDLKLNLFEGSVKFSFSDRNKFDINLDLAHPILSALKLARLTLGFNYQHTQSKKKESIIHSNILVKWQKEKSRTANYYEFRFDGKFNFQPKTPFLFSLAAILYKDTSLNKLMDLELQIKKDKKFFETELKCNVNKFHLRGELEVNVNDMKNHLISVSVKTNSAKIKEFTFMSKLKSVGKSYQGTAKLNLLSTLLCNLEISQIVKLDLANGLDMVSNVKWTSNIPYLNSGSYIFGVLIAKVENYQINFSLIYKNAKKINFKFSTDTQREMQAYAESFIVIPLKFSMHVTVASDNKVTSNLEFGYKESYLKISNFKINWKTDSQVRSSHFSVTILSSNEDFNDIVLSTDNTYKIGHFFTTWKAQDSIKYKEKVIYDIIINLEEKKIKIESLLGQYVKGWKAKTFKLDFKYTYQSVKDWSFNLLALMQPYFDEVKLEYVYFRKDKDGSFKTIDTLGEAMFYNKIDYVYKTNQYKEIIFVDKSVTKGHVELNIDFPGVTDKLKNVIIKWDIQKVSDNVYTGTGTYKDVVYKFKYEKFSKLKKSLQIDLVSGSFKPKKIHLTYDFEDKIKLKYDIDDYINVDIDLKKPSKTKYTGPMKLTYKGEKFVEVEIDWDVIIPSDVETLTDYLKALVGIKKGLHIKNKIVGKLGKHNINRIAELYHLDSVQFPGGTKSFINIETVIESISNIKYFLSFDRNFPKFDVKEIFHYQTKEDNYKAVTKAAYLSNNNILIDNQIHILNILKSEVFIMYNQNAVQTQYFIDLPKKNFQFGFGFRNVFKVSDIDLHVFYGGKNRTISTNLGDLFSKNVQQDGYLPVGKEYFIEYSKIYTIRLARTKDKEYDMKINYNWSEPVHGVFSFSKDKDKKVFEGTLKVSSSFEKLRHVLWKFNKKYGENEYKIVSSLRVNRKLASEMVFNFKNTNGKSPYTISVDYEGSYNIKSSLELDFENYKISSDIETKTAVYKSFLWNFQTKCGLKPNFDCYWNYINEAREMAGGISWKKDLQKLQFFWNKNKREGFLIERKIEEKKKVLLIESPWRKITLSRSKSNSGEERQDEFNLDVMHLDKSLNKDIFIKLVYKMVGSLKSDYKLDLNLKTSLMHKGINLSVKRDVSVDIGDLYLLDVKVSFEGENNPFFGIKGNLKKLSSRSYEMSLFFTNRDKFANLTATAIFASEEFTLEYKLIQSDKPTREFIVQYIPFSKLHISNKRDFTILMSRVEYQYGYKSDYVFKLGKEGPSLEGFAKLTRNPRRYYAQFITKNQKTVIHMRPVGNYMVGEIYKKTSNDKVLEASLKMHVDDKNIFQSKIYWHPELFDRMKNLLTSTLEPKNYQNLMVKAYDNYENYLSNFMQNVKKDIFKNVNGIASLEFMKGVANDWEKFPKQFALSYKNDDYYIKTMMDSLSEIVTKLDMPSKFLRLQTSMSEMKDGVSSIFYEWFINAKLYSVIYQPLKDSLNSFTYNDVKEMIEKTVKVGKNIFKIIQNCANKIGDILDKINEKVKGSAEKYKIFQERLKDLYKNSVLAKLCSIISDINEELLNILQKVLETDILKKRAQYYKDAFKNSEDWITFLRDFKKSVLNRFKTSNVVQNIIKTVDLIKSMKYKEAFFNIIKLEEAKIDMDLDKATIDFQFYVIPMSKAYIKAQKALITWFPLQNIYRISKAGLKEKIVEYFYKYEYMKFNYGTLSYTALRKLFPPYSSEAWVLNGRSIITFDGNSIKIGPGKCSYLLVRDFRKLSFSIIMNVDPLSKIKEFELSYIKKITILQNGMVKVDGKEITILPKFFSEGSRNFVIYRDEDLIKIKTSEGLVVKYFYKLDSFKVLATGYWHGFLKGLFGSNDFDKINDYSTPLGIITHDAGVLSESWKLGKCDGKTKTKLHMIRVDQNQLQQCVDLFGPDSESYLKRCNSLINPEPYFELCHRSLQYSTKNKADFKNIICSLSRNYVMRCKSSGIMLRLDSSCVTCSANKKLNQIISQTNIKVKKFNYIFIMEQSECLLPYKKLVENLVNMMALKKENIFTLISFNGKNFFNDVNLKSINNQFINTKSHFMNLLDDFWSENQLSLHVGKTTHPGKAIFDAIKMSSKPEYVEKIVIISCSKCSENQKYIYSLLAGLLSRTGISVTYLTKMSMTGVDSDSNTIGLGNNLVYYFDKDSNIVKSRPWKRNVQAPKDTCSALARLNQGFVWSFNPMDSEMKMRRAAEVIHAELEKDTDSITQKCYCTAGNYEDGRMECKVSKSKRSSSLIF